MDRAQLLNDSEEALRIAFDSFQSSVWTAMPGVVQSVDLDAMTCEVQPAIQGTIVDENGDTKNVDYPLLTDVPIVFPSAGGFIITFPIKSGDEVLVVFASRCIDAWWQSGGVKNQAMEIRMHDLSDGFAIPGPRSQPKTVDSISSTGLQIRNDAGTSYVEIAADGKIKLVSPGEIDITAPAISVTGAVVVSGSLTAGSLITGGGLNATGAIVAASVTAAVVSSAGKVLSTHIHPGVTTGPGDTGPPV